MVVQYLASVQEGPPHHEIHGQRQRRVPENHRRGQPARARKKDLVKPGRFGRVDIPHLAAAGDEQHPHLGVDNSLVAEVPVAHPGDQLHCREGGDDFLYQGRGARGLGRAAEAEAVPPQDRRAPHPGQHHRHRIIGEDRGHGTVRGLPPDPGGLPVHGQQVLHGQVDFQAGRGAGRAGVLPGRLDQGGAPGCQPLPQTPQNLEALSQGRWCSGFRHASLRSP